MIANGKCREMLTTLWYKETKREEDISMKDGRQKFEDKIDFLNLKEGAVAPTTKEELEIILKRTTDKIMRIDHYTPMWFKEIGNKEEKMK